jgi:acetyl esterase
MKTYDIDPQLKILKPITFNSYSKYRRITTNALLNTMMFLARPSLDVKLRKYKIPGYLGEPIKLRFYELINHQDYTNVILYLHGGGFQIEGNPVHLKILGTMMKSTGYKGLYVHYRLAPEYPFPIGLMDCYETLKWLDQERETLKIKDIIVAGDSAGGNLAAAVSLLARDLKGPKIVKKMMFYPVIDNHLDTESMQIYDDTPIWNSKLNRAMWENYLKNGDQQMIQYASLIESNLENLPKTYIETAEFDCLRDEAIRYAKQLKIANNEVVEVHTKRSVHGYDACFMTKFVKDLYDKRIAFLKESTHEEN